MMKVMSILQRSNHIFIFVPFNSEYVCVRAHSIWSVDRFDVQHLRGSIGSIRLFWAWAIICISRITNTRTEGLNSNCKLKCASIIHTFQQRKTHTHAKKEESLNFLCVIVLHFTVEFFSLLYSARVERALSTTLLGKQSYCVCMLTETKDSISFKCCTMHRIASMIVAVCPIRVCFCFFLCSNSISCKIQCNLIQEASSFIHHTLNKFM